MSHSFIAYIDESGDDGLSGRYREPGKGGGASHWLGIGAVVWRVSRDLDAVQWAKEIIEQLPEQRRKKPLHFAELQHPQRIMAINSLSKRPLQTISVLTNKPTIPEGTYNTKNKLYHYMSRYLIERISWLCRDIRPDVPEGDGRVRIVFSRRGGMSDNDFKDYLRVLKAANDPNIRIHWPVVDIDAIKSFDQAARFGLQLADLSISSICTALEPDFYGNCEPRFARTMKPRVYNRDQNYLSYGAKIVPAMDRIEQTPQLREFTDIFGG